MFWVVTALHVIVCLVMILVVLLQSGKAADLAGAFGGMGSQTVFGPRGTATVLSKATTVAAALFMVTSLALVILANGRANSSGSVLENHKSGTVQQKKAPAKASPAPLAPAKK
jgi:preprotein translocase subunit SecG